MSDPPGDAEAPRTLDELFARTTTITTRCGRCSATFEGDVDEGRAWFAAHRETCPERTPPGDSNQA